MTNVSLNTLFPRTAIIGFDRMLDELNGLAKQTNDNYPPHNIVKTGESDYSIELAIAGFSKDDLTLEIKDRVLTVLGEHNLKDREYIHRGISTKKFKKTFRLSEHVHVKNAEISEGILTIELKYTIPEELLSRKIPINYKNN